MSCYKRRLYGHLVAALFLARVATAQTAQPKTDSLSEHLEVAPGVPLRLYIVHRVSYQLGAPVEARFAEGVWAFDRVVIPAGTAARGVVSRLEPVPKMVRARAIVGGDFTPLKRAQVSFSTLVFPDGRTMKLETQDSPGLATMYVPPRPSKTRSAKDPKKQAPKSQVHRMIEQTAKQQARGQLNARTRGLYDVVRGPNKVESLENFLLAKLPYHPQWYRTNTRFDAVLMQPLDFGTVSINSADLKDLGTQPAADAIAQVRIVSSVSSVDATPGDPLEGVLSQPLFSKGQELVLPEGTRVTGKVTLVSRARYFHRNGKLRFDLDKVEVPTVATAANTQPEVLKTGVRPVRAELAAVEADPRTLKVDSEGTATATESKTRFLRPAIAAIVAAKSMDNDSGKQTASGSADSNTSGQALGGFSGFGLFGMAVAAGPPQIGAALGFYGLGWSVYSNVVSRGREVTFDRNTGIAIRFGASRK